jgi:hypothetical protein
MGIVFSGLFPDEKLKGENMTAFQDTIGGSKIYTEQERIDILCDSFVIGMGPVKEALDLTDDDVDSICDWYRDIAPNVISQYRKELNENELDAFLYFTATPLAKKVLPIQVKIQEKIMPKLQIFLASLEEIKIKERKEKRMVRNMNDGYENPEDEWDAR